MTPGGDHVKTGSDAAIGYEAAGLGWLGAAGPGAAPVVPVLTVEPGRLVTARLDPVPATAEAAERFGAALAATHDAGAATYGCGPDGWDGDGFIGQAPLPLRSFDSWGEMYATDRLQPYLRQCRGELGEGARVVERVCDRVAAGDFDDDAGPARIHGDLWAGNLIATADGLTLIDPAAHGGHRITDLAMLSLFGHGQLERVLGGYAAASEQLPDGWRDLVGLHQLHHLLVHVVLFGGGYAAQTVATARAYA